MGMLTTLVPGVGMGGGTAVVVVVPDAEGLEYTVGVNRCHYSVMANRTHYTNPINRLHYSQPDEDA